MKTKLTGYIEKKRAIGVGLADIDTDARLLFDFLCLIVDINKRQVDEQNSRRYNDKQQLEQVLADQITSVESGLQGSSSTEVI